MDRPFEDDFRAGRHLQVVADALHELGARAAQQSRELVLAQRVRHRRHRGKNRRRVGAERHRDRERLAGMRERVIAKIERAAAMREPAHDDAVRPDHLLAIDAEVLPRLVRPARHRQPPGDERPRVARPAGLHGKPRQIDVLALPDGLLARRRGDDLRRHVEHLGEQLAKLGQPLPGIAQSLGRLGLAQRGEQPADVAQRRRVLRAHRQRNAAHGAEEIAEHGHAVTRRALEEDRRAARAQHAIADLRHLQARRDFRRDATQLAERLEPRDEFPQVGVFHAPPRSQCANVG